MPGRPVPVPVSHGQYSSSGPPGPPGPGTRGAARSRSAHRSAVGRVRGEERTDRGLVERRRGRRRRRPALEPGDVVAVLAEDRDAGLGGPVLGRGPCGRDGLLRRWPGRHDGRLGRGRGHVGGVEGVVLARHHLGHGRQHDLLLLRQHVGRAGEHRLGHAGGVADDLGEEVGHAAGGGGGVADLAVAAGLVAVQHLVAQAVERAGDAGPHLARAQHHAVLARGGGDDGARLPGPTGREAAVEQAGEVGEVAVERLGGVRARGVGQGDAVQGGVDAEPDEPDAAAPVDQHVLGVEPAVGDAGGVGDRDRVGDLGDDPGRHPRSERGTPGHHDVERGAPPPLVDDVADLVGDVGVEHAQRPPVEDGRGATRGGHQRGRAVVVGADHVDRHVTFQHPVVGPPEATVAALGEEVDQPVAVAEDVTGPGGVRHLTRLLGTGRRLDGPDPWRWSLPCRPD